MTTTNRAAGSDAPLASADAVFGTQVRAWRQRRGLTQQELATQLGTSQRKVSDIETGRRSPSLTPSQYVALAQALELEPSRLLEVADPGTKPPALQRLVDAAAALADGDIDLLARMAQRLRSPRPSPVGRSETAGREDVQPVNGSAGHVGVGGASAARPPGSPERDA
jgi:transcriptional regulator with XRE-family HTH domain